jgi:excisionase family DNA binding protein
MTVAEASSYLHLTPTALRARVRRGTVPAHRDGTRYLFHRGELDAHLLHADAATMLGSSSADGPARLHPPGPWLQGGNLEAE